MNSFKKKMLHKILFALFQINVSNNFPFSFSKSPAYLGQKGTLEHRSGSLTLLPPSNLLIMFF